MNKILELKELAVGYDELVKVFLASTAPDRRLTGCKYLQVISEDNWDGRPWSGCECKACLWWRYYKVLKEKEGGGGETR